MGDITDFIIRKMRKQRAEKGFSLEYMAEKLKMSTSAYSNLEHNKSRLLVDRLHQMADILEVCLPGLLYEVLSRKDKQANKKYATFTDYQESMKQKEAFIAALQKENACLKAENKKLKRAILKITH